MLGKIVAAVPAHARLMAPNVRAAEIRECRDGDGLDPLDALLRELDRSASAWSWIVDDEVACMWGVVAPTLLDCASYPWFLSTPLVERHYRAFARACKTLLPEFLAHHPRLIGMVDARYILSVRWLEWLGARLDEPVPWGLAREPFRRFELGG